jgi:hypothetical protein
MRWGRGNRRTPVPGVVLAITVLAITENVSAQR